MPAYGHYHRLTKRYQLDYSNNNTIWATVPDTDIFIGELGQKLNFVLSHEYLLYCMIKSYHETEISKILSPLLFYEQILESFKSRCG